tara:strand:- start:1781 stop:2281 length:501 start_codon:yes stop_codon:yes gene_type:complete
MLGNLKNSNIYHILDINNNNICKNARMTNLVKLDDFSSTNKFKLCKLCQNRVFKKISIYSKIFYRYKNILYKDCNDICKNKVYGIIGENGDIDIKVYNFSINCIEIDKIKYFLINNTDLYDISNIDVLDNIFNNKLGKLLGPKMAIIKKNMIYITKLKYNLWYFNE